MDTIRDSVGYVVTELARAQRHAVAAKLANLGLYPGQEVLLLALWARDGQSQQELAAGAGVEAPTVSKSLGRMERAGLIERRRDPSDARVSRVYLTENGKALEAPVRQVWEAVEATMLADFTLEERLLLRRLLQHARQNLAAADEPQQRHR